MLSRVRRLVEAPSYFPLRRLMLCLDCDACFDIRLGTCPACGSKEGTSLARFLETAPQGPLRQLLQGAASRKPAPKQPAEDKQMARQLFIVARNRGKLYEYVRRAFAGNPSVQVILDRRTGDRRQRREPGTSERRRADRRARLDVDNQLRALGWAIVLSDLLSAKRGTPR